MKPNFVSFELPEPALAFGFVNSPVGSHGSRTIMLRELALLLEACPSGTNYASLSKAIIDDNVLLKTTLSTRKESQRRLREFYVLDEQVVLFRALRDLWELDAEARPLLAFLCATARDPLLRVMAEFILEVPAGVPVTPQHLEKVIEANLPGRYNPMSLANIGRHAASSWQQSGHLVGRQKKVRAQAHSTPAATAYALMLGYLCGARGEVLFHTMWARLLDAPIHQLRELASIASQQGMLEYRHSGAVTEITFHHLLRPLAGTERTGAGENE
jgi:hypothetical protein